MLNREMLKETVSEYRRIIKNGGFATIHLDCEDGDCWVTEYTDCNSWGEYPSESIVDLIGYIGDYENEHNEIIRITLRNCEKFAKILIKGWEDLQKIREEERI